jgi:type 1 glutamine amidotransferase
MNHMNSLLLFGMAAMLGLAASASANSAPKKPAKIVMIAGNPSHGPGEHEFNAGILLLADCLKKNVPDVDPVVVKGGWPQDESVLDGASTIVFYMDGGDNHPMIQSNRLETMKKYMDRGVGLVCMHYGVEFPKGPAGDQILDWLGGYYETAWSTNPHWTADIKSYPKHPIANGVKPFAVRDEWYFNMRFRQGMKGVTAILVAKPDDEARSGKTSSPRGPYKHIVDASGRDEILGWATERPNGGRSFGFTGGHFHKNWGDENQRKVVLNAILWTAHVPVPKNGVESTVTPDQLAANLDPKGR